MKRNDEVEVITSHMPPFACKRPDNQSYSGYSNPNSLGKTRIRLDIDDRIEDMIRDVINTRILDKRVGPAMPSNFESGCNRF